MRKIKLGLGDHLCGEGVESYRLSIVSAELQLTYLGIHDAYCGFAANIHLVSSRRSVIESHDDVVCVCVCVCEYRTERM